MLASALAAMAVETQGGTPPAAATARGAWVVDRYTVDDGLPQLDVQAIAMDGRGCLWVGTLNGVARFDGSRFEVRPRSESGDRGDLSATFIATDGDGGLWVATHGNMRRRTASGWWPVTSDGFGKGWNPIVGVSMGGSDWFLAGASHWMLATHEHREHEDRLASKSDGPLGDDRILLALPRSGGGVAVRLQSGSWREYDPGQGLWSECRDDFEAREESVKAAFDAVQEPMTLFSDSPDSIWVGGRGEGLVHVHRPASRVIGAAEGMLDTDVWSVDPMADGSSWVGTRSSVERWSEDLRPATRIRLASRDPRSVLGDGANSVLFTDGNRIERATAGGRIVTELGPVAGKKAFRFLARGAGGSRWAGGDGGVWRQTPGGAWEPVRLPAVSERGGWLHALESDTGEWWCGSLGSGAVQHTARGDVHWTRGNGAPSDSLAPFAFDPAGGVWFGSTEGVVRFLGGSWTQWRGKDGLGDDLVLGLAALPGWSALWVQEQAGLEIIGIPASLRRGEALTVPLGGSRHRLRGMGPVEGNGGFPRSLALDSRGRVFAATSRGLLVVNPWRGQRTPVPWVSGADGGSGPLVSVAGDSTSAMIHIPAKSAGFIILQIGCSEQPWDFAVRLEGWLEGIDAGWTLVGKDKTLRYRDLPPGRRALKLASIGPWGRQESTTILDVAPRWDQRLDVRIGAVGSAVALAAGIGVEARRRIRCRIESQQRRRLEGERWRIARDLHDSVGAGLARISMLTFRRDPSLARDARQLMRDLEQSVWVINPKRDDLVSLVDFLAQDAGFQVSQSDLQLELELPEITGKILVVGPVRRSLLLALRGILANTLKHSGAARVRVSMGVETGVFRLTVEDDGRGFDLAAGRKGRGGLEMLLDRVLVLGGRVGIRTGPGAGTTVNLEVPLDALARIPDDHTQP